MTETIAYGLNTLLSFFYSANTRVQGDACDYITARCALAGQAVPEEGWVRLEGGNCGQVAD